MISVYPKGVVAALPALIHAKLHGCSRSSCPEQNHTANPYCMQLPIIFDNSGPDRIVKIIQKVELVLVIRPKQNDMQVRRK